MPEVGLAIITYRRRKALQQCAERVRELTHTPYHLVVADDGSEDGTAEWLREQGIRVVTGERRGVVWNRNRALTYLAGWTDCDPIIMLEDDGWPAEPGWEQPWVEAAKRWGHVSFALLPDAVIRGSGTPEDPVLTRSVGGLCIATSRAALWAVGFLDTRFQGYGFGHAEWSYRFARLFSGRWHHVIRQPQDLVCLCLQSGIEPVAAGSWCDMQQRVQNQRVYLQLRDAPIWRPPARDESELQVLVEEIGEAVGLPPDCVHERLRHLLPLPGALEEQPAITAQPSFLRRLIPAALRPSLHGGR